MALEFRNLTLLGPMSEFVPYVLIASVLSFRKPFLWTHILLQLHFFEHLLYTLCSSFYYVHLTDEETGLEVKSSTLGHKVVWKLSV